VNYDFRLDVRKSCLTSDIPPVNGSATRFFRNALRRSSFASIMSTSACFAATTAPIYFTKLIPHFSHFTPVRCLLPQDGHSKRIVMWQRWQKRATSRTAAPHLGQGIVVCGTGAAVGSQAFAGLGGLCSGAVVRTAAGRPSELGAEGLTGAVLASGCRAFGWSFAGTATSGATSGGLPPPSPEDELRVIPHLNGDAGPIRAMHHTVRPLGYPVRRYRYVKVELLPAAEILSRRDNATGRHALGRLGRRPIGGA
jgi:hypothetical protein